MNRVAATHVHTLVQTQTRAIVVTVITVELHEMVTVLVGLGTKGPVVKLVSYKVVVH